MTLLTIIQDVTDDLALSKPTTVIGNTDRQIVQLLAIANREGKELASRYRWSGMLKENLFTLIAAQDQGKMNSAAVVSDLDFDYIINDTFWDRTRSLPIPGPISALDWQTLLSFPVQGPYLQFRIQGQKLLIHPIPPTHSVAFEYQSTSWCETSGEVGKAKWSADNDTGILDENLMTLGIRWRWLQRKGMEYGQDFDLYERMLTDAKARDGGKPRLLMNSRNRSRSPGIFVPRGSWDL